MASVHGRGDSGAPRLRRLDRGRSGGGLAMRALIVLAAAALLIGGRSAEEAQTPTDIVAAAPASAWRDDRPRRSAGHGPRERRPGRDPARARLRAGPRRQHPALARGNIGTARRSIGCRTIMSRNGALNESDKPWPAGVTAKPPAEYTRPLKGLTIRPLGYADPYAPGAGLRGRLAGRLQPQGGLGEPRPLLRQRRRRPRPVARHGNRRRALCGHRPCARASSTATSRSSAG